MSLINKVLKQIENAYKEKTNKEDIEKINFFSPPLNGGRNKITLLIFLLIVFFVLVLIMSINKCTKTNKTEGQPAAQQKAAVQAKKVTLKAVPAVSSGAMASQQMALTLPVELNNISVNVTNDKTTLTLALNQLTLYYLEHDDTQKHLTLTLNNTQLKIKNNINLEHTAIKSITTKQFNNKALLYIEVLPETQVIGLQFNSIQPSPTPSSQLQLVLLNSSTPQGKINKIASILSPEQIAAQKYQHALNFIANNDTDSAIKELSLGLKSDPNNKKIRETLATVLITNGQLDEANDILAKGLQLSPYYPKFAELQAYICIQKGRTNEAINILEQNSPDISTNVKYYALLANLYQRKQEYIQAARIYDQLTHIEPNNGMWWIGLGIALEGTNKKNAALEAFQSAEYTNNLSPELRSFVEEKIKSR